MDGKHKNERAGSGLIAAWREWIAPVAVAGILALAVAGTVELINGTGREPDKRPTGTQMLLTTSNVKRPAPRFAVVVRRPGDGKTVVTGVSDRAGLALTAFPAAGGRPGRVLRRFAGSAGPARLTLGAGASRFRHKVWHRHLGAEGSDP